MDAVVVSVKDIELRRELALAVNQATDADVFSIDQLYSLQRQHELWKRFNGYSRLAVLADMYPRPVEWVLKANGVETALVACLDVRNTDIDCLMQAIGELNLQGNRELVEIAQGFESRWYPVIDRSMCTACGQCAQFCLFGVYSLETGVEVLNPELCKPGCPACSRVCPSGAIMFPLYDKDPAISGAPGKIMSPDPVARAMYYQRTGAVCRVCSDASQVPAFAGGKCPECGRELQESSTSQTENELDKLIDEFDKLKFGR